MVREVGRDHGKPEALTANTQATVARLKQFITDRNILKLPDPDRCQVLEMPEFQRGNSIAFFNSAPPLDADRREHLCHQPAPKDWDAARVESFLSEYNSQMLQILTLHEAYPGHYVQLDYANRNPSLLRRVLGSGTFEEGWANYCEQMMLDQGYGDGDLALRLMQLKFYLRTVANAILDHKMHCAALTDDEALRFLTRRRLPIRRRSPAQGHPRQAEFLPAFHLFRRPDGFHAAAPANAARTGRRVQPGPLP